MYRTQYAIAAAMCILTPSCLEFDFHFKIALCLSLCTVCCVCVCVCVCCVCLLCVCVCVVYVCCVCVCVCCVCVCLLCVCVVFVCVTLGADICMLVTGCLYPKGGGGGCIKNTNVSFSSCHFHFRVFGLWCKIVPSAENTQAAINLFLFSLLCCLTRCCQTLGKAPT